MGNIFCPADNGFDIIQPKLIAEVMEKGRLFRLGIKQYQFQEGERNLERQTRETGASTHIDKVAIKTN
jgi:hypothetical protein